jgi:hypothetical protein
MYSSWECSLKYLEYMRYNMVIYATLSSMVGGRGLVSPIQTHLYIKKQDEEQ